MTTRPNKRVTRSLRRSMHHSPLEPLDWANRRSQTDHHYHVDARHGHQALDVGIDQRMVENQQVGLFGQHGQNVTIEQP